MKIKQAYILISLLFICTSAFSQRSRYMVFFKDKQGSPYTLDNPGEYLSEKAIARRMQQGISVTEHDIPVNAEYIQGVKSAGADVYFPTRWMNGVLVQCESTVVPSIEELSYVDRVELVAPNAKLPGNGRINAVQRTKNTKASVTDTQLKMIGIGQLHQDGYKGQGITIAVFDGGFLGVNATAPFQHLFQQNKIDLTVSKDFVANSGNVFQYDTHGTEVFSVIAAYQEGTFTGGAYEANFQLYVTEDVEPEHRIEEYNWLFAAERADSAGVDIISSSLGYNDFDGSTMDYPKSAMDGKTTVVSRAAQFAADRGIVVVCSAGNEGSNSWGIITAPADAVDVLAVGSVNAIGLRSGSSSTGPTADGRIKPDVAAMGVSTSVVKQNGSLGTTSGTSLATPLITSLAALVWQKNPELTNKEVMDAIRKSGSQANNPDNLLGYGIPNYNVVGVAEQILKERAFRVYPNPVFTDTIIIEPFDARSINTCRIEFFTSQGHLVFKNEVDFSSLPTGYKTNVGSVSPGIYFMRIFWSDKTFTYKLIKM